MRGVSGGYWEWMGLAGDSYSVFVDLDETHRLASSPPVVDVHTKTRSRPA